MRTSTPGNTAQRLSDMRRQAHERFVKIPALSAKDEDWKGTLVETLDLAKYQLDEQTQSTARLEKEPASVTTIKTHVTQSAATVVFTKNGVHQTAPTAKGVVFTSLKSALAEHGELVEKCLLATASTVEASKFEVLNDAYFEDGLFLYVPKGVSVEAPFLHVTEFDSQCSINRVLIHLEEGSQASLVSVVLSPSKGHGKGARLFNNTTRSVIEKNARLSAMSVLDLADDVFAIDDSTHLVKRDGFVSTFSVALGGYQTKGKSTCILKEQGASSDLLGIVLGRGKEHFAFNTVQEHAAPDTKSNINFRIALKDESVSIYQGIIKVDKEAQKTDAFQSNKNLLLSSKAKAESIPKLEILADDVKCSHGATVGPVDKEQIFYLQSRGLTALQAEELVVSGFFKQVVDRSNIAGAQEWIASMINEKLSGNLS